VSALIGGAPELGYGPGIHEVDEHTYHREIKRLSKSLISDYLSPMHLLTKMNEPEERKEAFDQGRAFHSFILEPDQFEAKVAIRPECDRRSNAGKAEHALFEEENAAKAWIKADYLEELKAMRSTIQAHPECQKLLAAGKAEQSLFWTDEYGLKWKMRADWLTAVDGKFVIVDLKKTGVGADFKTFQREITNRRYHWQAYLYREGFAANFGYLPRFVFIAVEDFAPNGVAIYELDQSWDEAAGRAIEPIRQQLAELQETPPEFWPGYVPQIQTISAPAWA
jgi:ATP-dependent exoDNAse (exonuclease V) beta subunit